LILPILLLAFVSAGAQKSTSEGQASQPDSKVVHPPVAVYTPEAQLPEEARIQGKSGVCLVNVIIDEKGNPVKPEIIQCTDTILANNSLAAVARYKFKPAQTVDGKAVQVKIVIEISFKTYNSGIRAPSPLIRVAFNSPPATISTEPVNGVYPITRKFLAPNTLPELAEFKDEGFGRAADSLRTGVACDVVLTIDALGKPSNALLTGCDNKSLAKPAVKSLLKSKFKPAKLDGAAVAVRTSVHLVFVSF
jgi:TonB family protein